MKFTFGYLRITISSHTIAHYHVAINRHFLPHSVRTFRSVLDMMLHNHWAVQPSSNPDPNGELHEKRDDCLKSKPFAAANPMGSHEIKVLLFHGTAHWRVMINHTIAWTQLSLDHEWRLYRMILQPKLNNQYCSAKIQQLQCCVPV